MYTKYAHSYLLYYVTVDFPCIAPPLFFIAYFFIFFIIYLCCCCKLEKFGFFDS